MSFSFDIPTTVIWASLCAVCTHVQQRCRSSRTAFLLILATVNTGTYTNDGVYRSLRFLITHSYLALLMQPRKYSYLQDVRYAIGISANRCNLNVAQGPSLSPLPHLNTRAPSTPLHPYKHINPMLQQLLPSTQHRFHRSSQFRPSNSHSCLNLTLSQQQRQ